MSDENELIQQFENLENTVAARLEKLGEITQEDHKKNVGKLWGLVIDFPEFQGWDDDDRRPPIEALRLAFLPDEMLEVIEEISSLSQKDKTAAAAKLEAVPPQIVMQIVVWGEYVYDLLLQVDDLGEGGSRVMVLGWNFWRPNHPVPGWLGASPAGLRFGM